MTPPPADINVDLDLAARLLADQHPELMTHHVRLETEGWDNVIFRLGDELAIRIPRREMAAKLVDHEQRWLPVLAPHLPITIPAPVEIGRPTDYFPYSWSVVPWHEGVMALHHPLEMSEASRLGDFLRALHRIPVPEDPPLNPYRGRSLAERRDLYRRRVANLTNAVDGELTVSTVQVLEQAYDTPIGGPPVWLHGDLHSKNVIAADGRIVSIIDWGDICSGDRATDLAALWILFNPANHIAFWESYGPVDDDVYARARAWAVAFGLMLYDSHHETDVVFAEAGLTTIRRAVLEPDV